MALDFSKYSKGDFLTITLKTDTIWCVFDHVRDDRLFTQATYFPTTDNLFYNGPANDINVCCDVRIDGSVRFSTINEKIIFLNKLYENCNVIVKQSKQLHKLKYPEFSVLTYKNYLVVYGGRNGTHVGIDISSNGIFNPNINDVDQFYRLITIPELYKYLPYIKAHALYSYEHIKDIYNIEDDYNIEADYDVEENYNAEEDYDINMDKMQGIELEPDHDVVMDYIKKELDKIQFVHEDRLQPIIQPADIKLNNYWNYPLNFNRAYKLGDPVKVRNNEEDPWESKFFACKETTSTGEKKIKTTDGKLWNYIE